MTTETMMTDAATTTEGQPATQQAANDPATGAGPGDQQQQPGQQPATEGQEPAKGAAKPEGDEGKEPQGAPESYEFQAPEGVTLDEGVIGAFSDVAKELDMPQAQAQLVLDKMLPAMQARHAEKLGSFYEDIGGLPDTWAASSTSDKEFGGEKLQENLAVAKKARDAFGTAELSTLLNKTGLGNHPEIIRFFFRAGQAISEDGHLAGRGAQASTDARAMYPGLNLNP